MLNHLDRKILKYIMEEKHPVSNKELALSCNVAINTIRKEIALINEEMEKHGVSIASKTSVGNYLEIADRTLAGPYLEKMWDLCNRYQRMDNQYPSEIHYLTRKCICCSGYVTVEELCQELYCSRGTMFRHLGSVKDILKTFDLTLKNKRGFLTVEGDEWSIRQCLIYQHKIYKTTLEETHYKENEFKTLFFMLDGEPLFDHIRRQMVECLTEQHDFSLPLLYLPKMIHYMQLSLSRRRQTANIRFTDAQVKRARDTAEYAFAQRLYDRLAQSRHVKVPEQDVLGLSMLLLAHESRNDHIRDIPEYREFYEETMDLTERLTAVFGCPEGLFDDAFFEDWVCFLYLLQNRLEFRIYSDWEAYGYVKRKGIRSADSCICFARFYEERHGIHLSKDNAISAFYIFSRLLKADGYCYYAQKILVISRYGVACAKLLALNIRNGYGKEIRAVVPAEAYEYVEDEPTEFDVILTDIGKNRKMYLDLLSYHLPILQVEFLPFQFRCPELDTYLSEVQKNCEWTILKKQYFYRTNLISKEGVFQYLADLFEQYGVGRQEFLTHMRENDSYVEMERENGVVLLPVLSGGLQQQQIAVLLNKSAIVWNHNRSQIFVCYNRLASYQTNQMLDGVLRRFVHISAETADRLVNGSEEPLGVLYPDSGL